MRPAARPTTAPARHLSRPAKQHQPGAHRQKLVTHKSAPAPRRRAPGKHAAATPAAVASAEPAAPVANEPASTAEPAGAGLQIGTDLTLPLLLLAAVGALG